MLAHTRITIININMYFIIILYDNNRTNAIIVAKPTTNNINKAVAEATTLNNSISIVVKRLKSLFSHISFDTN